MVEELKQLALIVGDLSAVGETLVILYFVATMTKYVLTAAVLYAGAAMVSKVFLIAVTGEHNDG